ncbi:MAG TPA: hypothetical protein PK114_02740 [Smithellaceae bacterium]|nr:hypothetical protein [Smithellaceae bacterium]
MEKKLSLGEIFQGTAAPLGAKNIFPAAGLKKKVTASNIRIISSLPLAPPPKNKSTIAIITPRALKRLRANRENPVNVFRKDFVLLIFSERLSLPAFFKDYARSNHVPIAALNSNEHYLKSVLRGAIREKFTGIIHGHGVVLEAEGRGILITGASGIGKTTAVLRSIHNGYYWVADDVAVIKRNRSGELIARGHKKICSYLHTAAKGITPVADLLDADRIKARTKLAAVIEVERSSAAPRIIRCVKKILGAELKCVHVDIPFSGYFNKNLLKNCIKELSEDN